MTAAIQHTIIPPADRLETVQEYYFSKKLREIAEMRTAGKNILNLGIGSPDLPPHPDVIKALHDASRQVTNHAYQSYSGIPELKTAFAQWYAKYFGVSLDEKEEVLPLIGSKEGIMHISMAFLNAGDEVLVPNPGYPAYRTATELAGGKVRNYDLSAENNWLIDFKALQKQDLSKVKLMWLNYPHMPTGTAAKPGFFERVVAFAKRNNILVINDNPYAFILNKVQDSILAVPGAMDVALELNSLSKAHNMAGWRVGMVGGAKAYLNHIIRFKSNMDSGMFKPVQLAAATALRLPESWYTQLNEAYTERRKIAFQLLEHLDCTYNPQQVGMFVWAATPAHYQDAYELSDEILYGHDVFLTPGGIFGDNGNKYVRISLCSKTAQLQEAIDRIRDRK